MQSARSVVKDPDPETPQPKHEKECCESGVGNFSLDQEEKETQCNLPRDYTMLKEIILTKIQDIEDKYKKSAGLIFNETCSLCQNSPLIGSKYLCTICEKFILCERCEQKGHDHPMLKYKINKDQGSVQNNLEKIKRLGFNDTTQIEMALKKCNNDYNESIEYLLFNSETPN